MVVVTVEVTGAGVGLLAHPDKGKSGQRRGADKEDKASLHGDSLVLGKGIATALASNQDYFEIYSAGMGLVELATVTLHNTKGLTVQEYQIAELLARHWERSGRRKKGCLQYEAVHWTIRVGRQPF